MLARVFAAVPGSVIPLRPNLGPAQNPPAMNLAVNPSGDARGYRLSSIDMLRGLVIVIMALDHVRDYTMAGAAQDPMADPNVGVGLFFTRWITHFCAPVFVCLAGVSAGLMVLRKTPHELAKFLVSRGIWLLIVEWFVIATALSFAPFGIEQFGGTFVLLQVIYAIGVSMLVLAAAQYLGRRTCLVLGLVIVLGHNLLDPVWPQQSPDGGAAPLWISLHATMAQKLGPFFVVFGYPPIPWIGVMLLGFGASLLFERPAEERNRLLLRLGVGMTAGFLVLRALDVYGDPNHWESQARGALGTALDFLNTTKYPPSLSFLLMTLGPAAIFCSCADRWQGRLKDIFIVFGRTPFAFYIPHFFLIHLLSVLLGVIQGFPPLAMFTLFAFYPEGYGVPLWGIYPLWLLVVVLLYPLCKWMASLKARRQDWWLSYV
jgi:uncharacterized membrane protein